MRRHYKIELSTHACKAVNKNGDAILSKESGSSMIGGMVKKDSARVVWIAGKKESEACKAVNKKGISV